MKNSLLTLLLLLCTLPCLGQSMFFDNLNSATWTSSSNISDVTLPSYKNIALAKLTHLKDSINKDVTIWTFRNGVLTIVNHSVQQKTDSIIGTYKYYVHNNSVLQITLQNGTTLKYTVGIASTGYYAVLYREKKKKQKTKT